MKYYIIASLILIFLTSSPLSSQNKNIALNIGSGVSIPLGEMRDVVDLSIPIDASFQYSFYMWKLQADHLIIHINFSLEVDLMYWTYTNIDSTYSSAIDRYNFLISSVGIRFWFSQIKLSGYYFGVGIGPTYIGVKYYSSTDKNKAHFTEILKTGYSIKISDTINFDVGLRYDWVSPTLKSFPDNPLSIYTLVSFRL